jgi:hypothetical protein
VKNIEIGLQVFEQGTWIDGRVWFLVVGSHVQVIFFQV